MDAKQVTREPVTATSSDALPAGTCAAAPHAWERQTHAYDMLHVRLRLICDEVLRLQPGSVFELGCGVGMLRRELGRSAPQVRYWGCDVSRSAVALANDVQVVWADLNESAPPFADETFDCIVGSGVLEYVRDVPRLLVDLRARLSDRGSLIVSYFNMNHVSRRAVRLLGKTPSRNPTWVNDYSHAELRVLLGAAGFRIDRELPSNLGLRGSPSVGNERWSAAALRGVRRLPFIGALAHQMIFVCRG